MAIAGDAGNCFNMQVVDGKLNQGTHGLRQKVQKNMDIAIQELLDGKLVHVHAYGSNHILVARTVEMVLKAGLAARVTELERRLNEWEGE